MKKRKYRALAFLAALVIALSGWYLSDICSEAAGAGNLHVTTDTSGLRGPDDLSFVKWTPDHFAWTVDEPLPAGEGRERVDAYGREAEHSYWYVKGETLNTGVGFNYPVAGRGQHLYTYDRTGEVAVAQWEVIHRNGLCIHKYDAIDYDWHDVMALGAGRDLCLGAYYSGWKPICADCGQSISQFMIYMPREKAGQIQVVNTDQGYFYLCPGPDCRHLEQGVGLYGHECKSISYNQYTLC